MGKWVKVHLSVLVLSLVAVSSPVLAGTKNTGLNVDRLATSYDHVVHIDNMADFLEHAGDENTALVVATTSVDPSGNYVFAACPEGVNERIDPGCGMVTLGPGTGVFGEGRNEIVKGLPTGNVLKDGPLFDCDALSYDELRQSFDWGPGDFNGWDLGCFEIFGGNTISGVQIDNGPDAVGQDPGVGFHRNGVLVQPGEGLAVIEHSLLTDVRRAALVTAGSGQETDFLAFANIARRTELSGFNLMMAPAPPASVYDARMRARLKSNYLDEIGRVSISYGWGVGGSDNQSRARFINNVIGSSTDFGLFVSGMVFLTPEPITDTTAQATISGGSIQSQILGVTMFSADDGPRPENDRNSVRVDLKGVTFSNTEASASYRPLSVEYDPWGPDNEFRLKMRRNEYVGQRPGVAHVCAFSYATFDCGDPGDDPPFRFRDSRRTVEKKNSNFIFDSIPDVFFK